MNSTTNMICVFVAGVAVGALGAVGIMKRMGYSKYSEDEEREKAQEEERKELEIPEEDKPSFVKPESLNTSKVLYHIPAKPDLEELAKKYQDPAFDRHMAEREHPEEDPPEEESDDPLDSEMADAMRDHPGQYEDESLDTDGYGHVIMQLATKRKDDLIFLVSEEWSGEVYPIEDLRWFENDDVLVDITDAPVDDVEHIIGSALEHFGDCGDPDHVYVRNATLGFEYEITKESGSFGAYIYGVSDEEVEIPERKNSTQAQASKIRKQKREEESKGAVTL